MRPSFTKKKRLKNARSSVKINWHQLGLTDPSDDKESVPIEEIRRQVTVVASKGLKRNG
ncbi:hypothetical protein [Candidatus Nitrospira bockiana]